jgi:hypothetical protein
MKWPLLLPCSIVGLYIAIVLVIGQFIRLYTADQYPKIMYTWLPQVDRVYDLCMEVYLVRECKEFHLEEILLGKLIYLYRSPAMMYEYSKIKRD